MDDERERDFGLREGLCADLDGDWRIHTVHADPRAVGVFYVGGWPYNSGGWPLVDGAPRLLDAWEIGVDKYIHPDRRQKIARSAYAVADFDSESDFLRVEATIVLDHTPQLGPHFRADANAKTWPFIYDEIRNDPITDQGGYDEWAAPDKARALH